MDIFEFGDAKLRANDLDPLYTAVVNTKMTAADRKRYTLAEVTFDLAGLAADITEAGSGKFWQAMHDAATQTKRGAPRRYFRGQVAHVALDKLEATYGTGEGCIDALKGDYVDVAVIIKRNFPQYGPCAAFKLADMAERVCGNKIAFGEVTAKQLCSNSQVQKGFDKACVVLGLDTDKLLPAMARYKWATLASPRYDRPLNQQEFETLLCYYSHDDAHNKHMPGMDSPGIEAELVGHGKLAQKLIQNLPHRRTYDRR